MDQGRGALVHMLPHFSISTPGTWTRDEAPWCTCFFALLAQVRPWMQFDYDGNYYPLIYFNDFWLLRDKLVLVNETLPSLTLHFDVGHIAFFW